MVEIHSFKEVHKMLQDYMLRAKLSGPYTLDRMRALMGYLGNPQDSYKIIHVAGTSGKTSTCYYLAAMLKSSGKKVGLSVSPHVDEVNERAQINLKPLTEAKFCSEFSEFIELVSEYSVRPTYFELLVAFAFWEFARAKVDYAVVEVGIGGLKDGTNVINREDKICVITDIGLDHIEMLGSTLKAIAAQKAGIIHANNHVFSYAHSYEVMDVIRKESKRRKATLHEVTQPKQSELPASLPLFQRRNWFLAHSAYLFIAERDGLKRANTTASIQTLIPARMEVIKRAGKTIIIDGAHNAQKLEALVASVRQAYPDKPVAVLASFIHTKRSRLRFDMDALLPLASHLITTGFETPGAPRGSVDPTEIAKVCSELGYYSWEIAENPTQAFNILLNRPEPVLLVTGSFFLLNHIRPLILKK